MSSNILIIGTNGFLGQNVKSLLKDSKENIFEIEGKEHVNLLIEDEIEDYLSKNRVEKIINCSAFVGGISYGYKYPVEMLIHNTQMTINLYNAASRNGVERIVNPISNCAYPGDIEVYKEESFWEGPPHSSVFHYGMSRRNIIIISGAFEKQFSLESSNVVLSNMYGPRDHFDVERSHALGALVKKFCDAKINGENKVEIWGTGEPIREWLYVEDGATALTKALDVDASHSFFNVGVNQGISIKDLSKKISNEVSWEGDFVFDTSKPDGVSRKTVDGTLGEQILKWAPEVDIDTGIKMTVKWYMDTYE